MQHYFNAFKNYCNTEGRASKKEIWMFFLFHFLIHIPLVILCLTGVGIFFFLAYPFASITPMICLSIRRAHDLGKSGWIGVIPIYSWILFIDSGDDFLNQYGPPTSKKQYKALY